MTEQTDFFFRRLNSFDADEVKFDHLDLQILTMIDQNKSARQIASDLNFSPADMKQRLMILLKQKVIKLIKTDYECMDTWFKDLILEKLSDMLGPLGSLIFDDTLEKLNLDADNIPKIAAKDFIRMIAKEIPDQEQSKIFTTIMLEEI